MDENRIPNVVPALVSKKGKRPRPVGQAPPPDTAPGAYGTSFVQKVYNSMPRTCPGGEVDAASAAGTSSAAVRKGAARAPARSGAHKSELSNHRSEIVELRAQLSISRAEAGTLRTQLADSRGEVSSLGDELADVRGEVDALRAQLADRAATTARLEALQSRLLPYARAGLMYQRASVGLDRALGTIRATHAETVAELSAARAPLDSCEMCTNHEIELLVDDAVLRCYICPGCARPNWCCNSAECVAMFRTLGCVDCKTPLEMSD
eukprot:jgi/Tetstr1/453940/TSEL_040859.t1